MEVVRNEGLAEWHNAMRVEQMLDALKSPKLGAPESQADITSALVAFGFSKPSIARNIDAVMAAYRPGASNGG